MASKKVYKFDAFISHADNDKDYCYELTEKLEDDGFKCFMYERDVLHNILEDIITNIDLSKRIIFVITPSFLESKWAMFESLEAIRKTHREKVVAIIPVFHELSPELCPTYLKGYHYYETKEPNFYERLTKAIIEDREAETLIPAGEVAHGLCWSYYYGFLNLVLPGLPDRCTKFLEEQENPKPMLKKMIIIIPTTCLCPNQLTDIDSEHFKHYGYIPYKASRAGNVERDYKSSVFMVTDPQTKQEYLFIAEFCTPLLSMYEMVHGQLAGLTKDEMFHQRRIFQDKLGSILHNPANVKCENRATILEYDNETPDKAKQLASIVCDRIREELENEENMAAISQQMQNITTNDTIQHD